MNGRPLGIALSALALTAPPAGAGTVTGELDVTFRAGSGEVNALTVFDEGDLVRFRDTGAPLVVAGPSCRLDGTDALCGPDLRLVRVRTGDGDDRYRGPAPADLGAGDDVGRGESVRGGPGADTLTGTWREDLLLGGPGSDVIRGGPDYDLIDGGRGRDVLFGGSGRDEIGSHDGERDVFMCGRGADVVIADALDVLVSCEDR